MTGTFPPELDDLQPERVDQLTSATVESVTELDQETVLVRVTAEVEMGFTQELDPSVAEIVESKFWDHFEAPEVFIDPKYRSASATVKLVGTAIFEIVAWLDDIEPTPTLVELAAFDSL